jgi:hydrogenase maturation protease
MSTGDQSVLIIGVGNDLLGDEGLGPHVARSLLSRKDLPAQVEVCEAGTALLDLLPAMAHHDRVILVDAIRTGREPGTVYRTELVTGSLFQSAAVLPVSLHEWGIIETLRVAEMLGLMPKQLTLLGAEPETLEPHIGLSALVALAAERIIGHILEETGCLAHDGAAG